ncbi:MAG: hypothetical protein ACREXI_12695, partial [Caldimonas sp.]
MNARVPIDTHGHPGPGSMRDRPAGAIALLWVLPYLALGGARYGFGQTALGEPLGWFYALVGLQLFATVALVHDVRIARGLAGAAALLYVAYFSSTLPGLAPSSSVLPQLCISALMAISLWLPFSSGQLSL